MKFSSSPLQWFAPLSPRRWAGLAGSRTGVLGLTTFGSLVVRTGSSILLTRLLSPPEFGIVGIITSVFFAVALITDLGFQDFLVRHEKTDDAHFRNVIWTIHAARGLAIFGLVALASPIIAWAFDKPAVATPLAVASLIFALNGVSSLSLMVALRHDKSRELSLFDFSLHIFQTFACLLFALWWRNAWSIIVAMLLQSALRTLLSYRIFPDAAHYLKRDRAISREFGRFSRVIMASSALTIVIAQTDKLVLGRVFTLAEFGIYAIALTIADAPVSFAGSYVNRIVYPICAKAWRDAPDNVARTYYSVRRVPAGLYAFACGGLIGSAGLVIALLYDPRYASASTFISLLMVGTALRLPNVATAQLMVAIGQVNRIMQLVLVRVVWIVVAIPVGLFLMGPIGVVAAISTVEVPAMFYCWLLLGRMRMLDVREELGFMGLIAGGALLGWAGSGLILQLLPNL